MIDMSGAEILFGDIVKLEKVTKNGVEVTYFIFDKIVLVMHFCLSMMQKARFMRTTGLIFILMGV